MLLSVAIARFSSRDAGKALLIGDSNVIKGSAKLTDEGGTVVGDFDIARSVGGPGILSGVVPGGITMMALAGPEDSMANAFADEICDRAFAKR